MGRLVNYISSLHKSTKRSYIERMQDNKVECMVEAKKYDFNYWDGDRRYGYGGYKFIDGRWKPVAEILKKLPMDIQIYKNLFDLKNIQLKIYLR